jgi:hypothetical protein
MNNNYLVIFAAHVDSEIKKNKTIKTLKHLKELNIDVCLSTHSGLYLDELSQYVKFVIYDKNNKFLKLQDYVDNSKYIDAFNKYGNPNGKTFYDFGHVSMSIPGSPHSKCALSLIRNGVIISELNNYQWTIYLEYDVKIPELGFKHFFEYHINELVVSGKKCFHYETKFDNFNFLWGGPFVFETRSVFNNEKFIKNDWYSSNANWVKEWHIGFFESILEYVIYNTFNSDEIISEIIQNNYKKFWDVNDLSELGEFNYEETFYSKNKYLRKTLEFHLYPNIDNNGNKKLYLYCNNRGDTKVNLNQILVYSDNILHLNIKNKIVNSRNYFLIPMDVSKLNSDDTVILSWTGSIDNEHYTTTESIKISDLENVHKNIMNITFN